MVSKRPSRAKVREEFSFVFTISMLSSMLNSCKWLVDFCCRRVGIPYHPWSIFLKFKGGKGVATGLGVIAMLMPLPTIIVFAVWFIIVKITGYVSLGSIVAAALVPVLAWIFGKSVEVIGFGVLAAAFIIIRHKENIGRLLSGKEWKIKAAKH